MMKKNLENLGDTLRGDKDNIALIDLANGSSTSYTYAELDACISASAQSMTIKEGTRVGMLGENSSAFFVTFSAILQSGGVAVPMNSKFPNETIAYIIKDAEIESVYVDPGLSGKLPDVPTRHELKLSNRRTQKEYDVVTPTHGQDSMVLYTSGSTGTPKGVLLSHDSQWAMINTLKDVMAGATGIVAAPLYHMNGLLFLCTLLAGGGTVVLMPRFDARLYLQAIHNHRVNVLTGVPTMLSLLLKEEALLNELDLSCVAAISVGSAPLSETLIEQVHNIFPNATITNGYGTTEAGAGMFGRHPDGIPVPSLSLGYAQSHVEVRLVNGTDSSEGVLEVRTPSAMSKYLNLPDKTAEKMNSEGWINTGDILRRDNNGFYYFVGRDDDMFNCGGENIYPGAIERILETDGRIAECCVVPVPDEIKGQKPVAFVVIAVGHTLTEDIVKEIALTNAPAYMHPRAVYFIEVMPLAGTNKIDRKRLASLATERTATNSH